MILVTEKNLNKYAYPVFSAKGRKIETPAIIADWTGRFVCQEGLMKPSNWIAMDILATYVFHYRYRGSGGPIDFNNKKPKATQRIVYDGSRMGIHEDVLDALVRRSHQDKAGLIDESDYKDIMKNYYFDRSCPPRNIPQFTFTDGELKIQIPFLKEYTSLDIYNMFKNTSECKVGMWYPVRFLDGSSTKNIKYSNYDYPCSFFTISNVEYSKISKDDHVLERRYTIRFNTYLGYFFVHNVVSAYSDWLPENFYSLSDTAQLYYRRCVLPFYNGVKSTLKLEEVQSRLQLKTRDTHALRKIIRRCMAELEAATYIKDPKEEYLYGHYCYTAHKTPWKQLKKD